MDSRVKKQLSVIILCVALLLVLSIIAAVILIPGNKTTKKKIQTNIPKTENVSTEKYDIIGVIYDADKKPMRNAKFCISIGPTDFITDENGYFRLNGLPVGIYDLYAYDANNKKIGETEIQLSNDGCMSIGYTFFEKGELFTILFNGSGFEAYFPEKETQTVSKKTETEQSSSANITPEQEDTTYTDFSWMKDVPQEFGAYGLNTTWNPELFNSMAADPAYSYINTYMVEGSNLEQALSDVKVLKRNNKRIWLNVGAILSLGSGDPSTNLRGNWRKMLDKWASEITAIAGDNFQGFYFDEVDLYLTSRDFTRVTKYMRETFGLRTFAVHRVAAFTLPSSKGMSIINYHPSKNEFVITPENHKYVTDVGFWWYGGYRWYGYNAERLASIWKDAMSQLDPNTRKWIVPPMGPYDWRHTEEDCMDVDYEMYEQLSAIDGFGGMLMYTMSSGALWGGVAHVDPDDKRLTDNDFLKDAAGNYVLDDKGKKIVHFAENNSVTAEDGSFDTYSEFVAEHFIIEKRADGTYRWPRARQYFEIFGKGITGGLSRNAVLSQLSSVYFPDRTRYK